MKPSIGRIVHFKEAHYGPAAAIITAVNETEGSVDLQVFGTLGCERTINVYQDETGERDFTWRWPPRE